MRIILAACGVCIVSLNLIIIGEWRSAETIPPASPPPQAEASPSLKSPPDYQHAAAEQAQKREAWSKLVLARPLFEPSRRPPAASRVSTSSTLNTPRLSGIMVTPEGREVIFVGSDGKSVILHEGGSIDGYTVQTITPDQAAVTGPDGLHVVYPSLDPNLQMKANVSAVGSAQSRLFGVSGLFASPPPALSAVSAPDQSVGSPASAVNRPNFQVPLSQAGSAFPGLKSPD